jgi:FkbM family methyltransferase
MTFSTALTTTIIGSLGNDYTDNYDFYRFGNAKGTQRIKELLINIIKKGLEKRNFVQLPIAPIENRALYIDRFEYLYDLLNDKQSKELLIKLLAYRMLGYKRVKLPTNNEQFWKTMTFLNNIVDKSKYIDIDFMSWKFYLFNLEQIGYPIKIYSLPNGIYINFILKQYEYNSDEVSIKVEKGDIVIDAGGFSGENALNFAYQAGSNGKIYSFEFIPGNIALMNSNINLNPELRGRIEIIQNALWSESGVPMHYYDNGPGSSISSERNGQCNIDLKVVSIDDFISENDLPKVNFIKMDIEGSELQALKGAMNTIIKYKPKLAISIYHKLDDFKDIPEFIKSLDLGYEFYLGHYTIHAEETVLYATTRGGKNY